LVVADGVKEHFLLFTELAHDQDILLGFVLLTARLAAEHGDLTLKENRSIEIMILIRCIRRALEL